MAFKLPYEDRHGNVLDECYVKIDKIEINHTVSKIVVVCGYYVSEEARLDGKTPFWRKEYEYYADDYSYIFGYESSESSAIHTGIYNKLANTNEFIEAEKHLNELQYHTIHGHQEIGAELAKQIEDLKKELEECKTGEGGEEVPNVGVLFSYVEENGKTYLHYQMAPDTRLAGFQFAKNDQRIWGKASEETEAGAQEFMVSSSETHIIGFSFSGSVIENEGYLFELVDQEGNPIIPEGDMPLIIETIQSDLGEEIEGSFLDWVPLGNEAKKAAPEGESAQDKADREAEEAEKIKREAEAEAELEIIKEMDHDQIAMSFQVNSPIEFEKPEDTPWQEYILELTSNVSITRDYARGLFNPKVEEGYNGKAGSPGLTRWFSNEGEGIDTPTFLELGFKREDMVSWNEAQDSSPPSMVGLKQVLYIDDYNGFWFDVEITSWQEGIGSWEEAQEQEAGGGFIMILTYRGDDVWYEAVQERLAEEAAKAKAKQENLA